MATGILWRWCLGGAWGVVLAGMCLQVQADTLVVLGDDAYKPVAYLKDSKPAGLLPAVLLAASRHTGDTYDLRLSPWRRAYEFSLRGDGGLVGISFNQERDKVFDFSKAVYDDNIQIVMLKAKGFAFSKLDDLKGKTIGGINGASYGDEVDKAIAAGLFVVERDVSQTGRLRKVLAGRLDAAFVGNGQAGFEAAINSHDELRQKRDLLAVLPTPLTRDPLHLAFPKSMGQRAALDRFDAAIEKMRKSGELKRLEAAVR